jgi:nitroimidazol reductase NimA-like FMN-containing flavoprotein (pyridoxamine 5'-phosphate oxidase superfamily)
MEMHEAEEIVRDLFKKQSFGVLATQIGKQPYTSLVAFASTDDMRFLLFVTGLSTSKFVHIKRNPHVAMLVDNHLNIPQDIKRAAAVTVLGEVVEIRDEKREDFCHIYLLKHPHLKDFLQEPSSVLLALLIRKIILVTKFQQIVEWEVVKESSMTK